MTTKPRRTVAIFDIDSTIANNDHRAVLLRKICKDCGAEFTDHSHRSKCQVCGCEKSFTPQHCWDAFLQPDLLMQDTPIPDAQRVISHLKYSGIEYHFVTGRNERLREVTQAWLKQHFALHPDAGLWMRPADMPNTAASVVKERVFHELCSWEDLVPFEDFFLFFEDDTHVFSMYQKYGIVVKCPEGLKYFCPQGDDRSTEPSWKR